MEYAHFATAVHAARHFRLRLSCLVQATARRFDHWVRFAGAEQPSMDRMTDEIERALAGERPGSPYHRHRYRR